MRYRVLSIGILVADIFVPPLEQLPASGELVATDDFLIQPGGCAANVAVALTRLGVHTSVIGVVGDDVFGELVTQELEAMGVDTTGVSRIDEYGTSKTVIVAVTGDDRRYIHTFGANIGLTAAACSLTALASVDAVYVGGYLILPGLDGDGLAAQLEAARRSGIATVLDVATPSAQQLSVEELSVVLPSVDYFIPNTDEALALTGEIEPWRQADRFLEQGARCVVIKRGAEGIYVRSPSEEFELGAPQVAVVDPSGAGDAFAAGLIVGILEGWNLERSVRFASVIGASACTALGCSAGIPDRSQAETLLTHFELPARTAAHL